MDVSFNHLSQQIFNKPLEDCSEQEIRSFVEQHPYFSPAQFLLLKKLDKNSEAYQAQYQKAILYYHDPLAFDLLINVDEFDMDIEEKRTRNKEQGKRNVEQETKNIQQIFHDNIQEEKSYEEPKTSAPGGTGNEEQESDNVQKEGEEIQTFAEQVTGQKEQLAFEPFHTVDYFASVGIKLSQEEVIKDRMGKQLKSFTEWLKTMKRLPVPELEKKMSNDTEQKVEHMAADSVQSADVITEAMADVWIKQGNAAKAVEVYNKLSLQNPSKRAYFAAKIDYLKEQN